MRYSRMLWDQTRSGNRAGFCFAACSLYEKEQEAKEAKKRKPESESVTPKSGPQNREEKHERSTAGKIAKEANVSRHKAEQAISTNAKRRNLTKSQLSAVAAESLSLYEAEAKERQSKAAKVTNGSLTEIIPQADKGEAREKAAKATGVNPRYVSDAKKIKEESPETFEKLKSGETTLQGAKRTGPRFDMSDFDLHRANRAGFSCDAYPANAIIRTKGL